MIHDPTQTYNAKGYQDRSLSDIHLAPVKTSSNQKTINAKRRISFLANAASSPVHHYGHDPIAFLLENPNQNPHELDDHQAYCFTDDKSGEEKKR